MEIKFSGDDSDAPRRALKGLKDYAVSVDYRKMGEPRSSYVYVRGVDVDDLTVQTWNIKSGDAIGNPFAIALEDIERVEVF
jgi:hypothetical protein